MMRINRRWTLAGMAIAAALLVGCGTAEDPSTAEDVEVVSDELILTGPQYDPEFAGGPATQCTVGGVTMHCCPRWQTGMTHYVMVGLDVAQNKFRCARLPAEFVNSLAVELHSGTRIKDGVTFFPACPTGMAMVGYHASLRKVACSRVSDSGDPLFETIDFNPPSGMRVCDPFSDSAQYSGAAMSGINVPGNDYLCLI